MSLPGNIRDRDYQAYTLCNDKVSRRVCVSNGQDEPIPVINVDPTSLSQSVLVFEELNSVGGFDTVDLLLYEVPAGFKLKNVLVQFSGDNLAIYTTLLNANKIAKYRTWWTNFNGQINFPQADFLSGDILKISVENKSNSVSNFNVTMQGQLYES
jgi:hypothetical protein